MTVLLVPYKGADVRKHTDVDEAKTAIKAEFDEMYQEDTQWRWRRDRHDKEWIGYPVGQDDELWIIKDMP